MISVNSAMRTAPASTIGEIGIGAGLAATAMASGVSTEARDAARLRPLTPSAIAAALASSEGWISDSIMRATTPPALLGDAAAGVPPNSRKFLRKESQERLIGMGKNVLTAPVFPQVFKSDLIGIEDAVNHGVDREKFRHPIAQAARQVRRLVGMIEVVRDHLRQSADVLWRGKIFGEGAIDFGNSADLGGDERHACRCGLQYDIGQRLRP